MTPPATAHRPDEGFSDVSASTRTPRALTIAGSDSGGGAGIQADLKAFARCGVHGCAAITAVTAQNTLGVTAVHLVPVHDVLAQVRAVVSDIGVDAVKVGMLATREIVHAVARALDELPGGTPVVVDPVMVAESGAQLLEPDAQLALVQEIVPRASVLTPNGPVALALGRHATPAGAPPDAVLPDAEEPETPDGAYALARAVLSLGADAVVLTGGHRAQAVDVLVEASAPDRAMSIPGMRHPDGAAHGSGCTHSSVLAAQLALGRPLAQAAFAARALAGEAVRNGLRDVGEGAGPVDVIGLADTRRRETSDGDVGR
ncbi:MAG: bifunctional hydroxymethylpyrimidine kinase/phosphomethylpyrimidine kinase [Solirubrobacteraceae bacterium]